MILLEIVIFLQWRMALIRTLPTKFSDAAIQELAEHPKANVGQFGRWHSQMAEARKLERTKSQATEIGVSSGLRSSSALNLYQQRYRHEYALAASKRTIQGMPDTVQQPPNMGEFCTSDSVESDQLPGAPRPGKHGRKLTIKKKVQLPDTPENDVQRTSVKSDVMIQDMRNTVQQPPNMGEYRTGASVESDQIPRVSRPSKHSRKLTIEKKVQLPDTPGNDEQRRSVKTDVMIQDMRNTVQQPPNMGEYRTAASIESDQIPRVSRPSKHSRKLTIEKKV